MISLVELAVRVGGLKVHSLPATNFEHHFVPKLVNTGKESWSCSIVFDPVVEADPHAEPLTL
jgi:hypothetical protein